MASIVVYSMAYRGDVYPFVPIASELVRRGHDVTYVVPREFHDDFRAELFRCVHSGTDFGPQLLNSPANARFVARWGMRAKGVRMGKLFFKELTLGPIETLYGTLHQTLVDTDADMVFTHPAAALVSGVAADVLDIPWVVGDLFPMLHPSAHQPPPGMPNLGTRGNTLAWRMVRSNVFSAVSYAKAFAEFRASKGLSGEVRSPIDLMASPYLHLGLTSSHYVPIFPDWPEHRRNVGFSFWAGPQSGEVDPAVDEFLDAGEPPVVVTLGTSAAAANPQVFEEVLIQLDRLGHRGLFLTSTPHVADAIATLGRPGQHAAWPFVPLGAVLPRARAIVHSGSHGTNAYGLAAGLPAAIIPALPDQLGHGHRQEALGTGVLVDKPRRLPAGMERLLGDPGLGARARELAAKLAHEDGVRSASDEIEQFLQRGGRSDV